MTTKELAHSIIDSFSEKQLKGFVDLFSDPEIGDKRRETDRILKKLARIHLGNFDDPQLEKETMEFIEKQCEEGYSQMSSYLYAYSFKIGEYKVYLRITMTLLNKGYSIEYIAKLINKPVKEIESLIELLKLKNLIELCKGENA